jgi:hypothetical protein
MSAYRIWRSDLTKTFWHIVCDVAGLQHSAEQNINPTSYTISPDDTDYHSEYVITQCLNTI